MSSNMMDVTVDAFKDKVLQNSAPAVVDFWAGWCAPCRMLTPTMEELADELDGEVSFFKVNVDEETELATAYGVQTIPTVILFRDGAEISRLIGLHSKEDLLQFIGK